MSNNRAAGDDPGGGAPEPAGGVQSVDRAISVLEILARRGEARVTEVAAEIAVHKSTAFRLLGALEERGLVEQDRDRGKYRLGFGIVRLAGAVSARMDITRHGRPVCERLAREIGETVNIAVAQAHYAVNVDQVPGAAAVTAQNWVGQLTPLHATSSGKILLAYLGGARRAELLAASGLERYTPSTITAPDRLEAELAKARDRGYATTVEEYELGLNAVAAPIRSQHGEVIAAVSASGPAYRFTAARLDEVAPALVAGADEISHRLGYLG
jgi:DNA-binding IclR family transcriptional regulator